MGTGVSAVPAATVSGGSIFIEDGGTYTLQYVNNNTKRMLGRLLRRPGNRLIQEIIQTLNGAASGSAASKTHSRIEAPADSDNLGGVRAIETVTDVSRNTDAADVTALTAIYDLSVAGITYPTDASGNGGGGKLGY